MKTFSRRASLRWTLAVAGAGTIFACAGQTLDAGGNDREGTRWNSPPSNNYSEACGPSVTSEFNGTWRGTFEVSPLSSGSRSLRLVVEATTATGICGSITFGDGEPPPLPTDREAPYAPGFEGQPSSEVLARSRTLAPVEGFVYQLGIGPAGGMASPSMASYVAAINLRQVYKAWCEIQYSYPIDAESLPHQSGGPAPPSTDTDACLPQYDSVEWHGDDCKVDGVVASCTQVDLCILKPACQCSTRGCTVEPVKYPDNLGDDTGSALLNIQFVSDYTGHSAHGAVSVLLPPGSHFFSLTRDP
jgi:hypothetical protein